MEAPTQEAIVLFGDSITQGSWDSSGLAQRLAEPYVRKLDVINRGFGGYNTDQAMKIYGKIFAGALPGLPGAPKVRLLAIWFGANDAAPSGSPQHVPWKNYRSNLASLVNLIKLPGSPFYSPNTRFILITPPPVNTHQCPERNFEQTKLYAEIVKQVGTEVGVPVADVWTKMWDKAGQNEEGLRSFLRDGLHLTDGGYDLVFQLVMEIIQNTYPEIHYDKLPYVINA